MPRYAVVLFMRDTESNVQKERLYLGQVKARNEHEAFGMVARDPKREYQGMPIVYHLTKEILK